jgi:hypothetical protein
MEKRKSSWVGYIAAVAFGLVVCSLIYLKHRPRPFDEASWKVARSAADYDTMFLMVDDLVLQIRERQYSNEEIVKLLGSEDQRAGALHRYRLGYHRKGLQLYESGWMLDLAYDETSKRVILVELVSD